MAKAIRVSWSNKFDWERGGKSVTSLIQNYEAPASNRILKRS